MSVRRPCYSPRIADALAFVAEAFRYQFRKGSSIPYLTHLLSVMVIVAEHDGDEDQMLAALLHDYLEDVDGGGAGEIETRFGARVAELVVGLSDTLEHTKPPWEARKRSYLEKLASKPHDLKLVSAADKLHNARSLIRDHARMGDALWDRFSATRGQTLWYYKSVVEALASGWQHPLLGELEQSVDELWRIAGEPSG
jgi:GTP pyrophosphokinase